MIRTRPAPRLTVLGLALPLLALTACNNSRDADDAAARPTADITASEAAAGMATMVPPVGSGDTPSDRAIPGAASTAAADAGRSGVNRSGANTSGANRPNAGATTPAIRQE